MIGGLMIQIKRIYEPNSKEDGIRILVDRLWPRGVSKERANIDYWLKDITPSHEIRKVYNHQPELHEEFKRKYIEELETEARCQKALDKLIELSKNKVTLLYAAKDPVYNHAVILLDWLQKRLKLDKTQL
jgi:uncharacterized protein YeaO (DUF488 family)